MPNQNLSLPPPTPISVSVIVKLMKEGRKLVDGNRRQQHASKATGMKTYLITYKTILGEHNLYIAS